MIRAEQDLPLPGESLAATRIPGLAMMCSKVAYKKPGNERQSKDFEHQTLDLTPTDR
jgi:hypothetical protein